LGKALETSVLRQMATDAARFICRWRSEVSEQWLPAELEIEPSALETVLRDGQRQGCEPLMLVLAILGAEWLLRARPATAEDVEKELRKIGNALERGTSDLNLAVFVLGAAQKVLRRRLEKCRYLVSYSTWTLPSPSLVMQLAKRGARPRVDYAQVSPITVVSVRRGPLPCIGPIVAAILTEGIAAKAGQDPARSEELAVAVAGLLQKQKLVPPEFPKWRDKLSFSIVDPALFMTGPDRRKTFRGWLIFRFHRHYRSMARELSTWGAFCEQARDNPRWLFSSVGDLQVARQMYAVRWA